MDVCAAFTYIPSNAVFKMCVCMHTCMYMCTMILYLDDYSSICGTLHSVDQFLNIKLTDISVTDPDKYPHMVNNHSKLLTMKNKRNIPKTLDVLLFTNARYCCGKAEKKRPNKMWVSLVHFLKKSN